MQLKDNDRNEDKNNKISLDSKGSKNPDNQNQKHNVKKVSQGQNTKR
ncbi:MAG: hypothetical protein GX896_07840 [Clostridiales bacterium]|nr:hypothetical protein [Clostridiales bacterium]